MPSPRISRCRTHRALLVAALSCVAGAAPLACSSSGSNGGDPSVCPAGYGPDATGRCCTPQGQCLGGGVACGPNASPTAAGGCSCIAPYKDCNGDVSGAGGDGCECATSCSGTQCTVPPSCDPTVAHACGTILNFCDAAKRSCSPCPANAFDCDGLGDNSCENNDARCGAAGQCSPSTVGSCISPDRYCNANTLRCEDCPDKQYNCTGVGVCESFVPCFGGCLPECLQEAEILCVKDPARGNLCSACLEDAHCRVNPRSRGPRCNVEHNLCYCDTAQDCAGDSSGAVCKQAGSVMSCGCNTDADCQVAPFDKCSPVVFGKCIKPCKSTQDCPGTQECDVASGNCYDAMP